METGLILLAVAGFAAYRYWGRDSATTDDMDFSEVETDILIHLHLEGDDVASNIADARGPHPNSVIRSASNLTEEGILVNKGRGVYRLSETGEGYAERLAESESL